MTITATTATSPVAGSVRTADSSAPRPAARTFTTEVEAFSLDAATLRTVSRCSCGWRLELTNLDEDLGLRAAQKACRNHVEDVHPDRTPTPSPGPRTTTSHVSNAAAPRPKVTTTHNRALAGHALDLGSSIKLDSLWQRSVECSCGWHARVRDYSPDRVVRTARQHHRDHVDLVLDRTPLRDYALLGSLLGALALLLYVMLAVVFTVSG